MAHLLATVLLALAEQDAFEVDSRILSELAEYAGSLEDLIALATGARA